MCVPQTLVIASRNSGKLAELRSLLSGWGIADIRGIGEFPGVAEVEEAGASYAENAHTKAVSAAVATGLPALGEDSGIEVEALGGRPGIRSARYGGPGLGDVERVAKLLAEIEAVPEANRGATFRAVAVLAWPDGRTIEGRGECRGQVARAPRGSGGFGYDPVFVYPETGLSFAETPPEEKARVSHRGRAIRALHQAVVEACAERSGSAG